eukprot:CAMPEP_0203759070 /NCGR_PEP_ID=MMETSP0098-20131031/11993_1 /ASSEMBLY_ACC=CAM_ASM_000208 /TAXON_ID=96639 /ORGANISM=" , Strain NY0313808BC1" /LENGTH=4879 /DNA_ID=CAMNT_0050651807 /DNA_START=180 /DNA_END=14816 /DNA_ORIENTATION=-
MALRLQIKPDKPETIGLCLQACKELRDRGIETAHVNHYATFLKLMFPKLKGLLMTIPPQFVDSKENQIRNVILDTIHRLPQNEALRPYVFSILDLATKVLDQDNEENALKCLTIIFDLNKTFREQQNVQIHPFFQFVQEVYSKMEQTISKIFVQGPPVKVDPKVPKVLAHSKESFKVITECPLIVMLMFQLHRSIVPRNIPHLVPFMVNAIKLQPSVSIAIIRASSQLRERYSQLLACQVKTLSFLTYLIRCAPYQDLMKRYENDIATSVVRLLQGCAPESISIRKDLLVGTRHILQTDFRKGFVPLIDQFLDESVLLGSHCVGSSSGQIPRAAGAQPLIPEKERPVLPMAYSTLADLVHHVRASLNLSQLSKVIYIFARNIHDPTLPLAIQSTSVRLLLNLVDSIFHNKEAEPNSGRQMLVYILYTLVSKFGSLRYYIPEVIKKEKEKQNKRKEAAASGKAIGPMKSYYYTSNANTNVSSSSLEKSTKEKGVESIAMDTDEKEDKKKEETGDQRKVTLIEVGENMIPQKEPNLLDILRIGEMEPIVIENDGLKEVKSLFGTMVLGLKTVLWCVCNYGPKKVEREHRKNTAGQKTSTGGLSPNYRPQGLSGMLNAAEMKMISNLFKWGFQCLPIYRQGLVETEDYSAGGEERSKSKDDETSRTSSATELEIISQFAEIFSVLDPHNFTDMFTSNMPLLYANIIRCPALIAFPKRLLRKNSVSHVFVPVLLDFVTNRFPDLAGDFAFCKQTLIAAPDLSNIIFSTPPPFSFKNVPQSGPQAAASYEGLGIENTTAKTNNKRPAEATKERTFLKTNNTYHDEIVEAYACEDGNKSAIMSQLVELIFNCMENYAEEGIAGNPPPSLSGANFGASQSNTSGSSQSATAGSGLTPGWAIFGHVQSKIEKIIVLCFVLTPHMSNSTQAHLRNVVTSPTVDKYLSLNAPNGMQGLLNKRARTSVQTCSPLGRDCYLMTLRCMLRVVARRPILLEVLKAKIHALTTPSLRALSQLLEQSYGDFRCSGFARRDLIAEVILLFAVRIPRADLHKHLPLLQLGFEVALGANDHRNYELSRLALRILESWVDGLGANVFEDLFCSDSFAGINQTFVHALVRILKPSPHPCGTVALRLLGKLGTKARQAILDVPPDVKLRTQVETENALCLDMMWSAVQHGRSSRFTFCMDNVVRYAVSYINDTFVPEGTTQFLKAKFSRKEDKDIKMSPKKARTTAMQDDELKQSSAVDQTGNPYYKQKAVELLLACIAHFVDSSEIEGLPDLSPVNDENSLETYLEQDKHSNQIPFLNTPASAETEGVHMLRKAERKLLVDSLKSIATACCDLDVGEKSLWTTFRGIVEYFVVCGLTHAITIEGDKTGFRTDLRHVDEQELVGQPQRLRTSSLASEDPDGRTEESMLRNPVRFGDGVDPTVINEVIVSTLCTACPSHSRLALLLIEIVVDTALGLSASPAMHLWATSAGPPLQDLMSRLIDLSHDHCWTHRLGGCVGIRKIMEVLPQSWVQHYQVELVDCLSFVLERYDEHLGQDVLYHSSCALQELIMICYYKGESSSPMELDDETDSKKILGSFVSFVLKPLFGSNFNARYIAKCALELLAKCQNCSVGSLLKMFPEQTEKLKNVLLTRSVRSRPAELQTMILDVIAFLLDQDPCPLNLTEEFATPSKTPDMRKRIVQTMADAIVLAETSERLSGGLSYIKSLQFIEPAQRAKVSFGMSTKYPGCLYAGSYVFTDVAIDARTRVAAVDVIRACLARGGTLLIKYLDSDTLSQKVRDRAFKLIFSSAMSSWPCVSKSARNALSVIQNISSRQTSPPVSHTVDSLLTTAANVLNNDTVFSQPTLKAISCLLNSFTTDHNQFGITVTRHLMQHLHSILSKTPPPPEDMTLEGTQLLNPKLSHTYLAAEIVKMFVVAPDKYLPPVTVRTIIQHAIRIDLAVERLTSQNVIKAMADARAMQPLSMPTTTPFFHIPGYESSPLIGCVLSLCNRFPSIALDVFFQADNLRKIEHMRFFRALLSVDNVSNKLRKQLITENSTKTFLAATMGISTVNEKNPTRQRDLVLACFQGVEIILTVVKREPSWLMEQKTLIQTLITVWRHPKIRNYLSVEEQLSWSQRRYYSNVCKIFMAFYRNVADRVLNETGDRPVSIHTIEKAAVAAFEMLTLVVLRTTTDSAYLLRFFRNDVVNNPSLRMRMAMVRHYIVLVNAAQNGMSPHIKEAALRLIVIPTLTRSLEDPAFKTTEVDNQTGKQLGEQLVTEIVSSVGKATTHSTIPPSKPGASETSQTASDTKGASVTSPSSQSQKSNFSPPESLFGRTVAIQEALQVQLLKLATLLVAQYNHELVEHRKELIKFAWNHLKNDHLKNDSASKQWAYVNICTFISVYQTPPEIILQVYVALLREHSSDARHLVRKSLDVLVPALPKRLQVSRYILSIRWTKKLIHDEGHKLPQLTHIWQLFARHPELFYQNRNHFVLQIIPSLKKLWSPQSGAIENRALAIDLAEMFLTWEVTRDSEETYWKSFSEKAKKEGVNIEDPNVLSVKQIAARDSAANGFRANVAMVAVVVHFFMRITLLLADATDLEGQALYRRCMNLFKVSLEFAARISRHQAATAANQSGSAVFNKSLIKFPYFAKQIEVVAKKHKDRAANAEKLLAQNSAQSAAAPSGSTSSNTGSSSSASGAQSSSQRELNQLNDCNLTEESQGVMHCMLEMLIVILDSDKETIAMPFVKENAKSLYTIISPMFGTAEKGARMIFLKFVYRMQGLVPNTFATPGRSSSSGNSSDFFDVLFRSIHSRLLLAADDGKSAVQQASQKYSNVQQSIQHAKLSQHKLADKNPKNIKGKKAASNKGVIHSKAAQQKAARAAAMRQAREIGAGPLGTLQTLRLIQVLCAKSSVRFEYDKDSSINDVVHVEEYRPKQIDAFANCLMKILAKLSKELTTSATARSRTATKASIPLGGSPTLLIARPKSSDTARVIASKGICIIFELLGDRILCHDAHRRHFIVAIQTFIDKLDAYDSEVLLCLLRLVSRWVTAPFTVVNIKKKSPVPNPESNTTATGSDGNSAAQNGSSLQTTSDSAQPSSSKPPSLNPASNRLTIKERQALMAKLEQLERFDGLPQARELISVYRDVVYKVFHPSHGGTPDDRQKQAWVRNLQAPFMGGLVSLDYVQRKRFFQAFSSVWFTNKGPYRRLQLLVQQDWSHIAHTNWLPIAVQILFSAVQTSYSTTSFSNASIHISPWKANTKFHTDMSPKATDILESVRSSLSRLKGMKDSSSILTPMQELGYGDRRCDVSRACWLEIFPKAWDFLEEQQKMIMTEGFQVLLSRAYHIPYRSIYFMEVQRSAVVTQVFVENLARDISSVKSRKLMEGVAADPFQESALLFSLRRAHSWERTFPWNAPSVLKCILEGLVLLRPVPIIAPELLQYLGREFGARHVAIELSELLLQQVKGVKIQDRQTILQSLVGKSGEENVRGEGNIDKTVDPAVVKVKQKSKKKRHAGTIAAALAAAAAAAAAKGDTSKKNASRWAETLLRLYTQDDDDMVHGVIRDCCETVPTFAGLALECKGLWHHAEEAYLSAMQRTDAGRGQFIVPRKRPDGTAGSISPYQSYPQNDTNVMPIQFDGSGIGMDLFEDDFGLGVLDGLEMELDTGFSDTFSLMDAQNKGNTAISSSSSSGIGMIDPLGVSSGIGTTPNSSTNVAWLPKATSSMELEIWKERWEVCAKQLGQWDQISSVASYCNDAELSLQSACRIQTPDWIGAVKRHVNHIRQDLSDSQQRQAQTHPYLPLHFNPNLLGVESAVLCSVSALHDSSPTSELDHICRQSANSILLEWATNRASVFGSHHRSLLVAMQRLCEVEEASSFMSNVVHIATASKPVSSATTSGAGSFTSSQSGSLSSPSPSASTQQQSVNTTARSNQVKRALLRWRTRSPLKYEDPSEWDAILTLRLQAFALAKSTFERTCLKGPGKNHIAESLTPSQVELLGNCLDTSWTAIKRAKLFRKSGLVSESLAVLASPLVYTRPYSSAEENFQVVRERILNIVDSEQSVSLEEERRHLVAGLNQLLEIDVSGFSSENKAELFRLRALLQEGLGDDPELVHMLFSQAVQVHQEHAAAWLDWALYAERLIQDKESETNSFPCLDKELGSIVAGGLLQAIKHGSEVARMCVPKLLWRLHVESEFGASCSSQDDSQQSEAAVSSTIAHHILVVPTWVWLPWIPQLVSFLSKSETSVGIARTLLVVLAQEYPNALYYTLRAQYFEKDNELRLKQKTGGSPKEYDQSSTSPATTPGGATQKKASEIVTQVKGTLARFHQLHPKLVQELEAMLEELSSAFKNQHPFEELHNTLHRLLNKCIQFSTVHSMPPSENVSPDSVRLFHVWNMLDRICTKVFSEANMNRSKKHAALLTRLRDTFERDLKPDATMMEGLKNGTVEAETTTRDANGRDMSIAGVILQLGRWKNMLSDSIYLTKPSEMPLYKWSRDLATMTPQELQIPGMHILKDGLGEPLLVNHPQLQRFSDSIRFSRGDGYSQPSIGFVAGNGQCVNFVVKSSAFLNTKSDQRSIQLKRVLNAMLGQSNSTRRRQYLRFSLPVVVPIHSRLTLMLDTSNSKTLQNIFEGEMNRVSSLDPKVALSVEQLRAEKRLREEKCENPRFVAFEETCEAVPINLLSKFIQSTVSSAREMQIIRSVFTKQYALSSMLTYLFGAFDRSLSSTVIAANGAIYDSDIRIKYKGVPLCELEVSPNKIHLPFRLSRNIEDFLTPAGVDGPLANAMFSAASCIQANVENRSIMVSLLELYLLHDQVDYNLASNNSPPDKVLYKSRGLHNSIHSNTRTIMSRLEALVVSNEGDEDDNPASPSELDNQVVLSPTVEAGLNPGEPYVLDSTLNKLIREA